MVKELHQLEFDARRRSKLNSEGNTHNMNMLGDSHGQDLGEEV
jgi:hypothetical protein